MAKYDITVQDHATSHLHDLVVEAESVDDARVVARTRGRIVRVHGIHGTTIAFDGSLAAGE